LTYVSIQLSKVSFQYLLCRIVCIEKIVYKKNNNNINNKKKQQTTTTTILVNKNKKDFLMNYFSVEKKKHNKKTTKQTRYSTQVELHSTHKILGRLKGSNFSP
jgi:hypothetical protein